MRLTDRQREILQGLRQAQTDPECEHDLVESGGEVWFGLERTSYAPLMFFLRNCLISEEDSGSGRYDINEWGRRVLDDPDFEPEVELIKCIRRAEQAGEA